MTKGSILNHNQKSSKTQKQTDFLSEFSDKYILEVKTLSWVSRCIFTATVTF